MPPISFGYFFHQKSPSNGRGPNPTFQKWELHTSSLAVSCRTLHKSMARALPPNLRQPIKNSSRSRGASIKKSPKFNKRNLENDGGSPSSESPFGVEGVYSFFQVFLLNFRGCIQYANMFPVHIKGQSAKWNA